jgi:hypothetical protein
VIDALQEARILRLSGDPPSLDRAEVLGPYVADLVPALR